MPTVFDQVRIILSEKFSFHYNQIQLQTKLELELGVDSREMLEIINELEIAFKIEINLNDIDQMIKEGKTIKIDDVVCYIEEKQLSNLDSY